MKSVDWLQITNDGVFFLLAAAILYVGIVTAIEMYGRYLLHKDAQKRAREYK